MNRSPPRPTGLSAGDYPFKSEQRLTGELEGERILVPLLNRTRSVITDQIAIALTLARRNDGTVSVVHPVSIPEQTPKRLRERLVTADDHELLEYALEECTESGVRIEGKRLFSRGRTGGILRSIETNDVDTLVLPTGLSAGRYPRKTPTERLAARAPCDVVTVNGRPGYDGVPSILLPVAGGPHSGVASDVTRRIAEANDAWIDVLHVVEEDASESRYVRATRYVEAICQRVSRPEMTATWILESNDVAGTIVEQSRYYGLTVVGAPTTGRLRRFVSGSKNRTVRDNAQSVVLSVRSYGD